VCLAFLVAEKIVMVVIKHPAASSSFKPFHSDFIIIISCLFGSHSLTHEKHGKMVDPSFAWSHV
jgi:hypothetical protein